MTNTSLNKSTPNQDSVLAENPLKQKIDDFINDFDSFQELRKIEKIDTILQENKKHPNSIELTKDLLVTIEKYKYVENGSCLKNSVHKNDSEHAKEVRKAIVREYKVTGIADKMMVDLAVASYFRGMRASSIYSSLIEEDDGTIKITSERNGMLKELNKQIDIATRQLNTLLLYLKEKNNPPVNIKVRTDNAFIANNQQFNKNA